MSVENIAARWTRARKLASDLGFDALLVTEKFNYWYFTGQLSKEFDKKMRPMLFLLPVNGAPTAIVYRQTEKVLKRSSGINQVLTYEDIPFPVELIAEAIGKSGLASARIGAEFGDYDRLGLGYAQLSEAMKAFPKARFDDASPVFEELRTVKMPDEIALIREACAMTLRAWDKAVGRFALGMTNKDVKRTLAVALTEEGSDFDIAGHVTIGNGIHGETPYEPGESIWADFGGTYRGYQADIARRAIFGDPNEEQLGYQKQISEILAAEIAAIKPGVRASEVARTVSDEMQKRGYKPLGPKKRVGHGVGLSQAEAPSLGLADDTILRPGMVLTPEPRFDLPTGERVHIEEVVVVTETGCEQLTTGAFDLAVVR
jgi:Xaa-Pro dipeptidase